jgi:multiple sugar transport system ATP-binding protein
MDVYKNPATRFVGAFIGSPPMNFIEGRIVQKDQRLYFDEGQFQMKIPDASRPRLYPYAGRNVTLGIRPEDIHDRLFISEAPPDNMVKAFLEVIEPMGVESFLHFKIRACRFIAKVPISQKPGANQDMELFFDMSRAHFFDKDTEKSIV